MNCDAVKNLLSAYLDREVSYEDERRIRLHLLDCPSCSAEEEAIRKTRKLLSSLSMHSLPDDFWSELRARLMDSRIYSSAPYPAIRRNSLFHGLSERIAALMLGISRNQGPGRLKGLLPWIVAIIPVALVVTAFLIIADVSPSRKAEPPDPIGTYFREHVVSSYSRPLADRPSVTYVAQGESSPGDPGRRSLPPSLFREPFTPIFIDSRSGAWGD